MVSAEMLDGTLPVKRFEYINLCRHAAFVRVRFLEHQH